MAVNKEFNNVMGAHVSNDPKNPDNVRLANYANKNLTGEQKENIVQIANTQGHAAAIESLKTITDQKKEEQRVTRENNPEFKTYNEKLEQARTEALNDPRNEILQKRYVELKDLPNNVNPDSIKNTTTLPSAYSDRVATQKINITTSGEVIKSQAIMEGKYVKTDDGHYAAIQSSSQAVKPIISPTHTPRDNEVGTPQPDPPIPENYTYVVTPNGSKSLSYEKSYDEWRKEEINSEVKNPDSLKFASDSNKYITVENKKEFEKIATVDGKQAGKQYIVDEISRKKTQHETFDREKYPNFYTAKDAAILAASQPNATQQQKDFARGFDTDSSASRELYQKGKVEEANEQIQAYGTSTRKFDESVTKNGFKPTDSEYLYESNGMYYLTDIGVNNGANYVEDKPQFTPVEKIPTTAYEKSVNTSSPIDSSKPSLITNQAEATITSTEQQITIEAEYSKESTSDTKPNKSVGDSVYNKEQSQTQRVSDNSTTSDQPPKSLPTKTPEDVINVVEDYDWTYSINKKMLSHEIPQIRIKEFKIMGSSYLSSLASTMLAGADGKSSGLIGEELKKDMSEFTNNKFIKKLFEGAKNAASSVIDKAEKFNKEVTESLQALDKTAESWESEEMRDMYKYLYMRQPTNFRYVLPYFEKEYINITNDFVDTYSGTQTTLSNLAEEINKRVSQFVNFDNLAPVTEPGMFIQRTKFYNFQNGNYTINVSFYLFNTLKPDEYLRNIDLITKLVLQNTPHRHNRILVDPPCLYELTVPGRGFYPYTYISELNVSHEGTRRMLDSKVNGKKVIIPDAFKVTLKFKSLTNEVNNFIVQETGNAGIDISKRYGVSIPQKNEEKKAQQDPKDKTESQSMFFPNKQKPINDKLPNTIESARGVSMKGD